MDVDTIGQRLLRLRLQEREVFAAWNRIVGQIAECEWYFSLLAEKDSQDDEVEPKDE